ncbi:MAG: hypothetical protein WCG03_11715, partial [Kiritimatiellales bacterium]
ENVLRDNYFGGNVQNIVFRQGDGFSNSKELFNNDTAKKLSVQGLHEVELSQFNDPAVLDFSPKGSGMPGFSTASAGLVKDEFRTTGPDKNGYRAAVRAHFQSVPSYDPSAVYNPDEISARRLNTGKILLQ